MIRVLRKISNYFFIKRMNRIHAFSARSWQVQQSTLSVLLEQAKDTEYGKRYNFKKIKTLKDFQKNVPLVSYEDIESSILEMKNGKQNILWSEPIEFFSKSSGTTGSVSKYIPVSYDFLHNCHYMGGKDMISLYLNQFPESGILFGKTFALAGSLDFKEDEIVSGDVSAVITYNLPIWAKALKTPPQEIALLSNWEEKSEKIVDIISQEDIRALAGAPSWILAILKKVQKKTGQTLKSLWPNLEVFFYGGTSISPFRDEFVELLGSSVVFMSIYNASEGFFAIQDDSGREGEMMLMLDYDIFYEFIHKKTKEIFTVEGLIVGEVYEVVITTSGGLWRYRIGDLVQVASINPIRITIVGRTKQYINVFGEELMVHNAEDALRVACQKTGAVVHEFTVGPIFQKSNQSGGHEWYIEFEKPPQDINFFSDILDKELCNVNSDYNAKRDPAMNILQRVQIKSLPYGTFLRWMSLRNKLGGQHKVPRLSNDRKYLESIDSLL